MLIGAFAQFNGKRTAETRTNTGAVTKGRPTPLAPKSPNDLVTYGLFGL
jgi:hypothetical protein